MAANNIWIIHFNIEVVDPVTKKKSTIIKVVDKDGDYTEAEVREHISKSFPNAKITKIEAPGSQTSPTDTVKPPVKPPVKPTEKPPVKPTEKPPEKPPVKPTEKPPVVPPKKEEPPAQPDSTINDIVKQKEQEQAAKEVEAARERLKQKAEQERLEKERAEKERQQNQPAPVVPPKKEEPPKETPPAPVVPPKKEEPPKETPPTTTTTTPQQETPPAKTKEQKRAEVEAKLQELEKSNDPAVREQAAKIRKKLEGGGGSQQSDSTSTVPSKVPTPSDQIGGTSDKPSTNAGPGKTPGDGPGNNQGPGKTTGDGNKPGNTTGNKTDAGKGKDEKGDKGPGTGTSGQGYWKDIGDNMVMWKGAPGTDSTFPGRSFKDGDIMTNPKYTVPTGGKGDDRYSSNNAEELRKQNRLKDEEIRKLKLRAGIK